MYVLKKVVKNDCRLDFRENFVFVEIINQTWFEIFQKFCCLGILITFYIRSFSLYTNFLNICLWYSLYSHTSHYITLTGFSLSNYFFHFWLHGYKRYNKNRSHSLYNTNAHRCPTLETCLKLLFPWSRWHNSAPQLGRYHYLYLHL